ncbi:MAG: hypothetical protein ABIR91_02195 [Candidatus Saccharimonadales bacterium]
MKPFDANNDKKPFHTSGYAEVAHGGSIGSTSSESFQRRVEVDSNRQTIGKYHQSSVASNLKGRALGRNSGRVPGRYVSPTERRQLPGGPSSPSAIPRASFSEPTGRTYNPFA